MNFEGKRVMKKFLALGVAAAWLISASPGLAASLGLETKPAPILTVDGDFTSLPGIFAAFDGTGGTSSGPAAATDLFVGFSGSFDNFGNAGAFTLNAGPGLFNPTPFLAATSSDFGFVFSDTGADTLEFLLQSVTGNQAGAYGTNLLATLTGEFGTEASFFASGTGFGSVTATLTVAPVSPIPLPASGMILLASRAALFALRRRRNAL